MQAAEEKISESSINSGDRYERALDDLRQSSQDMKQTLLGQAPTEEEEKRFKKLSNGTYSAIDEHNQASKYFNEVTSDSLKQLEDTLYKIRNRGRGRKT